jgi:hypothetical protein
VLITPLYSHAPWVYLPGGRYRLGKLLCLGIGDLNHLGYPILSLGPAKALAASTPEVFNIDRSSQFTSGELTGSLEKEDIRISMGSWPGIW